MADITPFPTLDNLRIAIIQLQRNLPLVIEFHQIDAEIKKAKYDALIKQGFTPEQALELTKAGG